jgi:ligand-binding sensor domain-containing protein/signal transduction histidine kinase
MKYTLPCFFWILLQVIGHPAVSQKQHIRFRHLGIDQGLSQSNATCILQDSRGFMWFGTRDGLNKYNGYGFTVYKKIAGDPKSLNNNFITSLAEDGKGDLWIGTWGGGLNRYDRGKDLFIHYTHDNKNTNSLSNDFINTLLKDGAGNIWIGTDGGGMDILDPATGRFVNHVHDGKDTTSISDNDVTSIFMDSRRRVWAGTYHGGLNLFDGANNRFTRFRHNEKDPASLSCDIVSSVFEDRGHRLWVGTRGGGLELFDPSRGVFHHFKNDPHNTNSLAHNVVATLAGDDDGNLWIGTENGGISILDPERETFQNYRHDDIDNSSLGHNSIDPIYKDTRGNMWMGTYSGGVDLYNKDDNKFANYKHNSYPHSLSNNNVLCLFEDSGKNIWVGTDGGGLELMDRATGEFTHFRHKASATNSIPGDYVLVVREDEEKNLWVGTWGDGLTMIDKKRNGYKHFRNNPADPKSLGCNNIYAITEDKDKALWVGTYGEGLDLYDRKTNSFLHHKHETGNPNSVSSDRIHTLLSDNKGNLWIGTFDGGLDRFDKKTNTFTHYLHDEKGNSLSNNSVNSLYENAEGDLWIGTVDGLNFLDRKTGQFTSWFAKDGLPNSVIFGILEDGKGNLWISTNNGLSAFNPKTGVFKNFSVADGLQSSEFKAHSCLKSADGAMYFGGVNGFNEFFPDSIKANSFESPLVVTSFQIFNKEVAIAGDSDLLSPLKNNITETKAVTLSYKQSVISFEFASLNYTLPEKKQYAYRLEGFDKKWNDIGIRHVATYTNLDPGNYVFKIRGLNNDGSWSNAITSLELTITPPFWKTWWFRLLAVMAITGGVVAYYKIRIRAIKEQKKELEQRVVELDKAVAQGKFEIASDVLHDIGNALVGFGSYLTRITRSQEQGQPENLEKLAVFFESQRPAMATAIGEVKSGAVVNMLTGIAQTQKASQEEIGKSVIEQFNIIKHIQEILHIQRQYITGKESQERKPVNIRNIINDCRAMLHSSIEKNAIAVTMDIPADLPPIKGDRTRLMQVFLQVFRNSLEAIGPDAQEKTISIRVHTKSDQLVLEIRDSGQGFDGSVSARLFEKGFTTKLSGAGMGLYNCHDIMESHDGSIAIASEGPGKGALVSIRLPLVEMADKVILSAP